MSVVVDTGVHYAHHDSDTSRYEQAREVMDEVLDGRFGQPYVSDYIYDEAVTLTRQRSGNHDIAARLGRRIRGLGEFPDAFGFLTVDAPVFDASIDVFEQYDDHSLSFTDATTIALVERRGLDAVVSFDDDFDGLVDRIDPARV